MTTKPNILLLGSPGLIQTAIRICEDDDVPYGEWDHVGFAGEDTVVVFFAEEPNGSLPAALEWCSTNRKNLVISRIAEKDIFIPSIIEHGILFNDDGGSGEPKAIRNLINLAIERGLDVLPGTLQYFERRS